MPARVQLARDCSTSLATCDSSLGIMWLSGPGLVLQNRVKFVKPAQLDLVCIT